MRSRSSTEAEVILSAEGIAESESPGKRISTRETP